VIAETAASELVVATIAGRRYVRVPTNNGGNVNGYGPRWFSGCAALLPWE
jgi:hypothetical protein